MKNMMIILSYGMKMKNRYLIVTTKSWNIHNFSLLKNKFEEDTWHLITDKNDLNYEKIKQIDPDYIFFPHWSWKIPKEIYENFECIVFHMTDLPFGRGGSPLQNLIVRGHKKTKISAIKVTDKLDAGPVYLKKDLSLDGTAETIYKEASKIIFFEMIPFIIKESPKPIPQRGKVTTFKRRKPKDSDISNLDNLNTIFDYIRMLDAEGYPKAFIEKNNIRIEFKNAKKIDNKIVANAKIIIKE
jgi:methionyl-tRNA formyltransferase